MLLFLYLVIMFWKQIIFEKATYIVWFNKRLARAIQRRNHVVLNSHLNLKVTERMLSAHYTGDEVDMFDVTLTI